MLADWSGLLSFTEVTARQEDDILDHLIEPQSWPSPPLLRPPSATFPSPSPPPPTSPELVVLDDESEHSGEVADECVHVEEQVWEVEEMEQVEQVEQVEAAPEEEFVCQVCDHRFPSGSAVSLHTFEQHLRGLASVWRPLLARAPPSAFPHKWVCLLCQDTFPSRVAAQLHIYSVSQHKRQLKRSMEERGENWQHTLEFVRFPVARELLEDRESEGEGREEGEEEGEEQVWEVEEMEQVEQVEEVEAAPEEEFV